MSTKHNRFKDADWYSNGEEVNILVGGAGGISSWTALLLTRAGFLPVVYDHDLYEEHNMSGQFVSQKNIGKSKVEALQKDIKDFTGDEIIIIDEWFTSDSMSNDVMVSGFDNMDARKVFFWKWIDYVNAQPMEERYNCLLIDGRLLAEQYQILSITGDDEKAILKYQEEYLFADSEVEEAMCTMKQTSHVAAMIAGRITSIVTNHYVNRKYNKKMRAIPFFYEEYIPIMLTTEKK